MRTVTFSGYCWDVPSSKDRRTPGPNIFSDSEENVSVKNDELRLAITNQENKWHSSEVALKTPLGYGTYSFTLHSDISSLARNAVFGAFLYETDVQEIDIEISPAMVGKNKVQFAIQPWLRWNHRKRVAIAPHGKTRYSLTWLSTSVSFSVSQTGFLAPHTSWTYKKSAINSPDVARFMFNLWIYKGSPVVAPQEILLTDFSFTPSN